MLQISVCPYSRTKAKGTVPEMAFEPLMLSRKMAPLDSFTVVLRSMVKSNLIMKTYPHEQIKRRTRAF
jgi:hypothetical protein